MFAPALIIYYLKLVFKLWLNIQIAEKEIQ